MKSIQKSSKEKALLPKHTPTNSGPQTSSKKSLAKKNKQDSTQAKHSQLSTSTSSKFVKIKLPVSNLFSKVVLQQSFISSKLSHAESSGGVSRQSGQKARQSKPAIEKARDQIKRSLANVAIARYKPQDYLNVSLNDIGSSTHRTQRLLKSDFSFIEVIGEGGYGRVWKAQLYRQQKLFAVKQMQKSIIIFKKGVENVLNQRALLEQLNHNTIANMHYAFQDRENLYLVLDLLPGGDLRWDMANRIDQYSQQMVKFLLACIILAVQHIHNQGIFHRDIKPQNLVFDQSGYLRLTDFGIARKIGNTKGLDASGTPGYMSPEVLCKQTHSFPCDYYALGVIAYQLATGKRPYSGNNRHEIRDAVIAKQATIQKREIPSNWSLNSVDFINKLLIRQANNRLGTKRGSDELKSHPWLENYPWTAHIDGKLPSPFVGRQYANQVGENVENYQQALAQMRLFDRIDSSADLFANYYY